MDLETILDPSDWSDRHQDRWAAMDEIRKTWKACLRRWPNAAAELTFTEMIELVRLVLEGQNRAQAARQKVRQEARQSWEC
jgi:gamma-glutamyl:cysteine ligase YbdK (ATP-grasp superfamily)